MHKFVKPNETCLVITDISLSLVPKPDLVVGMLLLLHILGSNNLVEPIPLQVCFWFEFRVSIPKLKSQSALLLTHGWRKNSWIHTFLKGISIMLLTSIWLQETTDVRNGFNFVYFLINKVCMFAEIQALFFHQIRIWRWVGVSCSWVAGLLASGLVVWDGLVSYEQSWICAGNTGAWLSVI